MTEHAAHDHAEVDHHLGHDNSPEAIAKEVRKYLYVFASLAALTIITVAISYFHLPTREAVILALIVATVKGSLVAAFFMHLISERRLVFAVLAVTVIFFGLLLWGPWHQHENAEKVWSGYDMNASAPAPASEPEAHP